jgi:hypothetical protein
MAQLKLVRALDAVPANDTGIASGADGRTAQLLAELDRAGSGADRELRARAAGCIRELIQPKDQATALMLESSALLRTALVRLQRLRILL